MLPIIRPAIPAVECAPPCPFAAGVAAVGLISSLLAWELERSRELAVIRSLGLTPAGTAILVEAQTGFMGLAALLARVVASMLSLTNAERGFLLLTGAAGELEVAARSGISWDDLRALGPA